MFDKIIYIKFPQIILQTITNNMDDMITVWNKI